MALASWPGLTEMAAKAAEDARSGRFSAPFFSALRERLVHEETIQRQRGDKQALPSCIKAAMNEAFRVLFHEHPGIKPCSVWIPVPGLPHGKNLDYGLTNGQRIYVIEQKSMLRFNEFAQVFLEALLVHRKDAERIRFAALFNYLHQKRSAFDQLCVYDGCCLIHHICVLIPDPAYTAYSTHEIEALFKDIVEWLA